MACERILRPLCHAGLSLALLLGVTPAAAQPAAPTPPAQPPGFPPPEPVPEARPPAPPPPAPQPPAPAHSPPQGNLDEAQRQAAKLLGEAGVELFRQGDYAGALAKFEQAEDIARVPTIGVRIARCLEKLGATAAAAAKYEEVIGLPILADAPEAMRVAHGQAKSELEALLPRVSRLHVAVVPQSFDTVVALDGTFSQAGMRYVEPGTHRVQARSGNTSATREVEVAVGQIVEVVLELQPDAPDGTAAPMQHTAAEPSSDGDAGSGQRTAGWVLVGLGGAGLAVFAVTGGLALGKEGDLSDQCPDDVCKRTLASDIDSYEELRTVSGVALGVGVAAAATGAILVLSAGDAESTGKRPGVESFLGLGAAGVRGVF